jgi:hypothetical protein
MLAERFLGGNPKAIYRNQPYAASPAAPADFLSDFPCGAVQNGAMIYSYALRVAQLRSS